MHRALLGWSVGVGLAVAALVGCAVGTDPDAAIGEADLTNLAAEAGDESSIRLPASNPGEDSGSGVDSGGLAPDAGTIADAGPDSGGGTDSGTGGTTCASPNVCTGATDLGTISGDTGADNKIFQGSGSQWFKIRVTENDNNVFGTSLRAKAELQSPTGTNFDVFVYLAGSGSGQECSAVNNSSTSPGGFDSATSTWGEGTISNGSSDERTVTVEVRHVSGTCAPAAKWTLTVRGNTP